MTFFDPDECLADIRSLVAEWNLHGGLLSAQVAELAQLVDDLDDFMSRGGTMPVSWRLGASSHDEALWRLRARDRRKVENLPPL